MDISNPKNRIHLIMYLIIAGLTGATIALVYAEGRLATTSTLQTTEINEPKQRTPDKNSPDSNTPQTDIPTSPDNTSTQPDTKGKPDPDRPDDSAPARVKEDAQGAQQQ